MVNKLIWLANVLAIANASPINARAAFARAGISLSNTDTAEDLTARQVVSTPATSLSAAVTAATAVSNVVSAVSLAGSQASLALGTTSSVSIASSVPGASSVPSSVSVSGASGVPSSSSVAGSSGTSSAATVPVAAGTPASSVATSSSLVAATSSSAVASSATSQSAGAGSTAVTSSTAVATGAAAVNSVDPTTGSNSNPDAYTFFKGDGSSAAGWPTKDKWVSFNEMFTRNSAVMGKGCLGGVTPNTDAETASIKTAITTIASASKVDPRIILATIMQESNGCVRVQGTPSGEAGVFNPGLMQSFKGTGTCNIGNTQQVNPCGINQITQMLIDGAQGTLQAGTPTGGIVQHINTVGGDASGQIYYKAARAYNSGSIAADGVLETAGQCGPPRTFGVPCYSSDIANRLMGWVSAPTACTLKPAASC